MRMSCNGCRVLRKGCSEGCTIRLCLQWIKSPEAQANATVFLAKFYGRAGLLNLLAAPGAGADAGNLRPAVFRSLLYEACGRIVNPVYGSVGLLWSGQWQACQAAVEAVLKGEPVVQVSSGSEAAAAPPLGRACDIRHVARDPDVAAAADLLRVARAGRPRFKRASSSSSSRPKGAGGGGGAKPTNKRASPSTDQRQEQEPVVIGGSSDDDRAPSCHEEESAGSHEHHVEDDEDMMEAAREGSEDTEVEARSHVSQAEQQSQHVPVSGHQAVADEEQLQESEEVGLELTLGFQPVARQARSPRSDLSAASSLIGLRLELPA